MRPVEAGYNRRLGKAQTLGRALDGAWGVFAVQNTWEAGVAGEEDAPAGALVAVRVTRAGQSSLSGVLA